MFSTDKNDETYLFNKIDTNSKKLMKLNMTIKEGHVARIESEEFLPKDSVKNFLPFNLS